MNSNKKCAQHVIGSCIRALREQRGYTLEKLANRASISYQYLSGIETGKENFSIAILEKVATGLDFPIRALIVAAYDKADGAAPPCADPACFRRSVPLPPSLTYERLELAMNEAQATLCRVDRSLRAESGHTLRRSVDDTVLAGLTAGILGAALREARVDGIGGAAQAASGRARPGTDVEGIAGVHACLRLGGMIESATGAGGWHMLVSCAPDTRGDMRFTHVMFAQLNAHDAPAADWKPLGGGFANPPARFVSEPVALTKLLDGSAYLDPDRVDRSLWKQVRPAGGPAPEWSIFIDPQVA